jgi:hypothetical protein
VLESRRLLTVQLRGYAGLAISNADPAFFFLSEYQQDDVKGVVTIDWGDGSAPETAGVQPFFGPSGLFGAPPEARVALQVSMSHTYVQPGEYEITAQFESVSGLHLVSTGTATIEAPRPIGGSVTAKPIAAVVGRDSDMATIAAMALYDQFPSAADYATTIDWGDGTSSAPAMQTIFFGGGPFYGQGPEIRHALLIDGSHTYAQAGTYTVRVSIVRADGQSTEVTTTATVSEGDGGSAPSDPPPSGDPGSGGSGSGGSASGGSGPGDSGGSGEGGSGASGSGGTGGDQPPPSSGGQVGHFGVGTPDRVPMTRLVRFMLQRGEHVRLAHPRVYNRFTKVTLPRLSRLQARIDQIAAARAQRTLSVPHGPRPHLADGRSG